MRSIVVETSTVLLIITHVHLCMYYDAAKLIFAEGNGD